MSEQNTNAQLEAYRKLVDDFKRFVSSEIRAEENSYRIVDMTSEDAEIDDPSVPVTQLEDEKAEKLAGICMDLSNATLWLYYNRDKFANVEFMLKTDPDALKTFDEVYKTQVLESGELHENMLQWDTATVKAILDKKVYFPPELNSLIDRIVTELVLETRLYIYNAERGGYYVTYSANRDFMTEVTNEELKRYPEELRPQLTGKLMKIDISEPSYKELLQNYAGYKNAKNDSTKMFYYNMFRQGLDILDLDDFTYQMLEMNPNSMGFWFPPLVEGLYGSAFFKVPDTKILRVPITMLQLTRLGFETLNPVTKEIVNRYCQKVFHLDGYEDYFIKTGTYSSKYEFRNAHIHNPKEINEMGEYFLFLNHLTCSMASPLNNRCFYGANTTNEWVVREYIKDKENNPTIYNGLPLHTEYRVFVDFDTKEILGASPYWRSDVMKNEFKKVSSPQERHDYVVYKMHEDILNQRYHESVQTVLAELKKVIPRIELTGQWSVDVMRNGNDYYIIDMALAENSALNDCVPKNLLRAYPQQWLPGESNS